MKINDKRPQQPVSTETRPRPEVKPPPPPPRRNELRPLPGYSNRSDFQPAKRSGPVALSVPASPAAASTLQTEQLGDGRANCLERAVRLAQPGDSVRLYQDQNDPVGHAVVVHQDGSVTDPNRPTQRYPDVKAWEAANPRYSSPVSVPDATLERILSVPPGPARNALIQQAGLGNVANRAVADGLFGTGVGPDVGPDLVPDGILSDAWNAATGAVSSLYEASGLPTPSEVWNGSANALNAAFNAAGLPTPGEVWDVAQTVQMLMTQDPGAHSPNAIDRSNLRQTDKAVINALGLDNIPPGGSIEAEVEVTADLAAVLGVEVGTKVTLGIERSAENPSEFTLKFGGGASVDGELTGDTAGAEANATAGVGVSAGIELTVDLSQPGGATGLAAFAAHSGFLAALPTPVAGLALAVEQIPGVNLPGEPLEFIREHLSAVEVGVDGHLSEELGAVVGAGVTATAEQYLGAGGRIEFNDDGTLTVKGKVNAGGGVALDAGVGAGGVDANIQVAGANGQLEFEAAIQVEPGPPPRELERSYTASITVDGQALGVGGKAKLSFELGSTLAQAPEDVRNRMLDALRRGDVGAAANIFQNEILPHVSLEGKLEVSATATLSGSVEGEVSVGGIGGGVGISGTVTTTTPVGTGTVTLDSSGLTVTGSLFGEEVVDENLTFQEMLELGQRAAA
ncbi:hypothetical protein NR798_20020 [Archangium gephyra]|uniref:hypothetical protein n=1 Tax=Archangium gephyra TaxID=48 RepID=UPI0035D467B1